MALIFSTFDTRLSNPLANTIGSGRGLKTRADKSGKVSGWDPKKNVEVELWAKQMRSLKTNVTAADVSEGEGYALLSAEEYAEKRRLEGDSSSEEADSDEEDEDDGGERKQAKLSFAAASSTSVHQGRDIDGGSTHDHQHNLEEDLSHTPQHRHQGDDIDAAEQVATAEQAATATAATAQADEQVVTTTAGNRHLADVIKVEDDEQDAEIQALHLIPRRTSSPA